MPDSKRSSEGERGPGGVTPDEVRRVAALARLRLDEASLERLTRDLNGILAHVEKLAEVELDGIAEPEAVQGRATPFREPGTAPDPLAEGAPADRAPGWREGFFVVPRLPGVEGP